MSLAVDCLFCSIAAKQIPSNIVYENEELLAFYDINPVADIHVLIIPKIHVMDVNALDKEHAHLIGDMTLLAKDLAQKLGVDQSGYRLVMNTKKDAGQTVFHLHLHLLGGRRFSWPPG